MGHKTTYRSKLRPQPHFRGILTLTSVQLDPRWILTPVGYSQDGEASVVLIAFCQCLDCYFSSAPNLTH